MVIDDSGTVDRDAAREEALRDVPSDEWIARLNQMVAKHGEPRRQRSRFSRTAWVGLVEGLVEGDSLSRQDVFDIAGAVRRGERPAKDLLTASFLWGQGTNGYGPWRLCRIVDETGDQLEPLLRQGLNRIASGAVVGYESFYGGSAPRSRCRPLQAPHTRIRHFGPSFFTKLIYFAGEEGGGLILDRVMARAVADIAGMPHLLTESGRAIAWTPYRYAVYLDWMHATAARLAGSPPAETLERALFGEYR